MVHLLVVGGIRKKVNLIPAIRRGEGGAGFFFAHLPLSFYAHSKDGRRK